MAPSATETTTVAPATEVARLRLESTQGQYKEDLTPISYDKDVETQGKEGFQRARVRNHAPWTWLR